MMRRGQFAWILAAITVAVVSSSTVGAISGSDFRAGNIIDDATFFNANSMNAQSIQAFLDAKVPTCDTNGTGPYGGTTVAAYFTPRGYPPPYTCIKNYQTTTTAKPSEPGLCNGYPATSQNAANIIYGVAQSCDINPRVLIVLLQKENGLITDDSPLSAQYKTATGYACPDTAACDTAYYGFFNQVYSAARQFKKYLRYNSSFGYVARQVNSILYSPTSGCGRGDVYISNIATSALYNYTPYQPNGAALANLYGSGDSCSAYGNRNFWRTFTEWFGTTFNESYDDISISQHRIQPIAFNGKLYTIYYDALQKALDVAVKSNTDTTWQTSIVDGIANSNVGSINANVGSSLAAIVYDNKLHVFYYDASNGNLRHGWSSDGTTWRLENFDGDAGPRGHKDGNMGANPTVVSYLGSLQVYYYGSGVMRHAWTNTDLDWNFETLDGDQSSVSRRIGDVGSFSTAAQYGDSLQLFYYGADSRRLIHAWTSPARGWQFEDLDGTNDAVSRRNISAGLSPTVAIYGDSVQLYYYDGTNTNLRHAWSSPAQGWQFEDLDGNATSAVSRTTNDTGLTSVAITGGDTLELYYYDRSNTNLRRAITTPTQGWQFTNIDGDTGSISSHDGDIGIQSGATCFNSATHVMYYDRATGSLRHSWYEGGSWHTDQIDQNVIY